MKPIAAAAWFALMAALFAAVVIHHVRSPSFLESSFKAFYCAGKAIDSGRDPYRVEPLRTCEHNLVQGSMPPAYVEPAPLPGFALAFFAALAHVPAKVAGFLFAAILWVFILCVAQLLSKLTRAPPAAVLVVLLPLAALNVSFGEIPPFETFALCVAGYALTVERWAVAGVAAALLLVEPHVGLPAVAAVAIFMPRTRLSLACAVVGLAVLSLVTVGWHANIEYVRGVLPAQAQSELVASDQYSLSRVLYALGLNERASLLLGELSYVAMAMAGTVLGNRAARMLNAPAMMLFVPSAAVLLFGVFMHDIQIVAALPAALMVAALFPARRVLPYVTLVLLAVVWTQHLRWTGAVLDIIAVAGAAVVAFGSFRQAALPAIVAAFITVGGLFAIAAAEPVVSETNVRTVAFDAAPDELASAAWGQYERATPALMTPRYYQQLPTWLGLILLIGTLAGLRARQFAFTRPERSTRLLQTQMFGTRDGSHTASEARRAHRTRDLPLEETSASDD